MRREDRGSAPGPRCSDMSGLMPSCCLRFSARPGFLAAIEPSAPIRAGLTRFKHLELAQKFRLPQTATAVSSAVKDTPSECDSPDLHRLAHHAGLLCLCAGHRFRPQALHENL